MEESIQILCFAPNDKTGNSKRRKLTFITNLILIL